MVNCLLSFTPLWSCISCSIWLHAFYVLMLHICTYGLGVHQFVCKQLLHPVSWTHHHRQCPRHYWCTTPLFPLVGCSLPPASVHHDCSLIQQWMELQYEIGWNNEVCNVCHETSKSFTTKTKCFAFPLIVTHWLYTCTTSLCKVDVDSISWFAATVALPSYSCQYYLCGLVVTCCSAEFWHDTHN